MTDCVEDIGSVKKRNNIVGVITADVVDSSKIPAELRESFLEAVHQIQSQLQSIAPFQMEIYRGDSFQIIMDDYSNAVLIAVLIRAGLKMSSPAGQLWDVRMSIGIGEVSYVNSHITVSDGEAFRYSGRGLELIGKKRLSITTPSQEINEELAVSTAFADDIITHWTKLQSERVFYYLLSGLNQTELAQQKGIKLQVLNDTLRAAKYSLMTLYLKRVHSLLFEKIAQR